MNCPICQASINRLEYRLRKALALPVLKGRCSGPIVHCFTFLPVFIAPAKWYGYTTIDAALVFVNQGGFSTPTAAFAAWEEIRETRIENGQVPGPGSTTVRRWQRELGQEHPERPWAERAAEAALQVPFHGWPGPAAQCGPDGLPGERMAETVSLVIPTSPSALSSRVLGSTAILLATLRSLGEAMLGPAPFLPPDSFLGIGLWFLEGQFQQRCLARFELTGNVVPGPVPEMAVTQFFLRGYPPQPPPPS